MPPRKPAQRREPTDPGRDWLAMQPGTVEQRDDDDTVTTTKAPAHTTGPEPPHGSPEWWQLHHPEWAS